MGGLCGWIGRFDMDGRPEDLGEAMAAGLDVSEGGDKNASFGAGYALMQRTESKASDWFENDRVLVAIHGYPNWPDPELQERAKRAGHARTIADLYEAQGDGLLQKLHGPFSLVVLDKSGERALLAIDRFGVHSLCYAQLPDGRLVFGTTTDSVRAHPLVTATIAPQTIYNFLYFIDRVCAPDTVYDEQKKLVPGECLLLERGRTRLHTYWRMPYGADDSRSEESLHTDLLEHLRGALGRSIAGEDLSRTGTFLSGGLDSSTVTSLLAESVPQGPKAFTIGFKEKAYDESGFAAIAARHAGADHDVYFLGPDDMLDSIPKLARAYDEPFANSSVVPAYLCALRAKQAGVDLLLAGDGGDELFCGNERYLKDRVFQYYGLVPRVLRQSLLDPVIGRLPLRDKIGLFRRANNYIRMARQSIPARLTGDNVYSSLGYREIFAPDAVPEIDPNVPIGFAESIYFGTAAESDLQRMMSMDLRITLADSDLRKVRRACDLAGVRVRFPFLDEKLAGFAAKVPPKLLARNGELRYFYKVAVRGILAAETIDKSKQGFGLPTFEYVNKNNALRDMFCDCLSALKGRSLFQRATLDRLIGHVRSGESSRHHGVVWDLAMLELWWQSRFSGGSSQ